MEPSLQDMSFSGRKQIKDTFSLIFLKLQRSRLKIEDLIFLKLQEADQRHFQKQIEDTFSLISLKLQRSRLKAADFIFLKLQEIDQRHFQPYLPEIAAEKTEDSRSDLPKNEDASLISLKLQWSILKDSGYCLLEVAVKQIEAIRLIEIKMKFKIPLKLQWSWKPSEEDEDQEVNAWQRPGKIGPFIIFALFSLQDNEQRGAASISQNQL
ncbi:Thymidylate synthase thyX [Gossypium australe]|uniref:Thymidylate synthase thyX n=1 Tax=Gossypium australe TaxID=47621 RepID=A0A5B6WET0_9ROSI|nr:Thymidylate synthase thyX [Gossypium australe]